MVGGVLEAKRRWDIAKKVINSISKEYPGVLPVWPKVVLFSSLYFALLQLWREILRRLERGTKHSL